MNATPPISQAPPPSPNPVQAAAPAASDPTDRSSGQDFARAMNAAGGKPVRKPAAKEHNAASGGGALPLSGNQPPPAYASMASAPPTTQAGTAAVSGNGALSAAASAPAAAAATTPTDPSNPPPAGGDQVATQPLASAAAEELAGAISASAVADLSNLPPTPSSTGVGASPATPPTDAAAQAAAPTATAAVATPPAGAAAGSAPKIMEVAASKANVAAATSAPTSANANAGASASASAPSAAAANAAAANAAAVDAAAQVAMAAAMAQGTSAPSPDSSASSDDLATPDTGVTLQGVSAANDVASPAPGAVSARATAAPTSASVTAATAAAIVQAVSASADSGPTEKHSRDNTPDGSVGAAQLLTSNAPSDAASGPTPTFKVAAGVDTADFGQGVADRVSLMMDGNLTSAKLQVNPPALGPIEVRIALQGGHAQVWMSSHSAVTRDALESTSPKLREMLSSQGFAQVSVDISQRSFQDRTPQPQPRAYENLPAIGGNSTATVQVSAATARAASGLLDAYA